MIQRTDTMVNSKKVREKKKVDEMKIERINALDYFGRRFPEPLWFSKHTMKVTSKEELLQLINKNIKINHIYISLYSASPSVIDVIWTDFDGLDKYDDMIRLHKYLSNNNLKHSITFSGLGWHIYTVTEEFKDDVQVMANTLRSALLWFAKTLNLKTDEQVRDISRISRLPGSFNHKPDRQRFCVPLHLDEIETGPKHHTKLAQETQRFYFEFYGEKKLDLEQFYNPNDNKERETKTVIDFEMPPLINKILNNKKDKWEKEVGWGDRFITIVVLKCLGNSKEKVKEILKNNLSARELNHAIRTEKQVDYIYKRDGTSRELFIPGSKNLISRGYELTDKDREFFDNFYIRL